MHSSRVNDFVHKQDSRTAFPGGSCFWPQKRKPGRTGRPVQISAHGAECQGWSGRQAMKTHNKSATETKTGHTTRPVWEGILNAARSTPHCMPQEDGWWRSDKRELANDQIVQRNREPGDDDAPFLISHPSFTMRDTAIHRTPRGIIRPAVFLFFYAAAGTKPVYVPQLTGVYDSTRIISQPSGMRHFLPCWY